MIAVGVSRHLHIDAGIGGLVRRLPVILGQPVNPKLTDGIPVADDEAVESPFAAQHIFEDVAVSRRRYAVQIGE